MARLRIHGLDITVSSLEPIAGVNLSQVYDFLIRLIACLTKKYVTEYALSIQYLPFLALSASTAYFQHRPQFGGPSATRNFRYD